jgi:hypothetical protein
MLLHNLKLFASPDDRHVYDQFVEAGVIRPNNTFQVAGQQICSICGDGFRHHMKSSAFKACQANGGEDTFFHELKGNGEAMRFALNSPLSDGESIYGDTDVWGRKKTDEIVELLGWADELNVSVRQHRLGHHWPCKAAKSRGISLAESIDLVVRGKLRIKQQIKGLCVAMDFFCDWGPDDHTSELIKKEAYLNMIESDPAYQQQFDEWLAYQEAVSALPVLFTFPDACISDQEEPVRQLALG